MLLGHPWIFSGSIERLEGHAGPGDTVEVFSSSGEWLARAAYSPPSKIRARVWTLDRMQAVDEDFLARRIGRALSLRSDLAESAEINAYREIYAEADGLPGLIVDRYAGWRVVQFLTAGAERWRDTFANLLGDASQISGLYERSDADIRRLEGLAIRSGSLLGSEPPEDLDITEYGLRFRVDLRRGHKTGFYLDQRENRRRLRQTPGLGEVLDCFCYTGGFTISAIAGGAEHVTAVEGSAGAIELARLNISQNGIVEEKADFIQGDVFKELRAFRDRGLSFDTIILDPPKFAATSAHVSRAARGYKDINLLAMKLLKPGGRLFTFSCSGGISPDLFQKIVAGAARDAGVDAVVQGWLAQPADHPVPLNFPEARYLKGLVIRRT